MLTGIEATGTEDIFGRKETIEGLCPFYIHSGYNDNHTY
jgi:hypothetical protein